MNGEHGELLKAIHKIDNDVIKIATQNETRDKERKWIILKIDQLCSNKDDCRNEWEKYIDKRFTNLSIAFGLIWVMVLLVNNLDKIFK